MEQNFTDGVFKTEFHDGLYSPKLEVRDTATGKGNFAVVKIFKGEIVVRWEGRVLSESELPGLPVALRRNSIQISAEKYLVPFSLSNADFFNHSCEPNLGLAGLRTLVAMRDIAAGEPLCYDYAMSDSSPYDEFDCQCGSPQCRSKITGNDWKSGTLQQKYRGYFSHYLVLSVVDTDDKAGRTQIL